jgi:hypothetical protein
VNVTEVFGAKLPCSEIDVVGARVRKQITEIIVVEAKDIDMPLHKPGRFALDLAALQHGGEQLDRKGGWVRQEWMSVLRMLGLQPTDRVVMTPLLVTRRYMAPNMVPGCAVVPLNMVKHVLSRLAHTKLGAKNGLGPLPRLILRSLP